MVLNLIVVQYKFCIHLHIFYSTFLLCNMIWIMLRKKKDFVEKACTMVLSDWFALSLFRFSGISICVHGGPGDEPNQTLKPISQGLA